MTPALSYAARSHTGMVRDNNEDSAYAAPRVLVLADGMGGHAAGELASQIMVATLAKLDEDQPGSDLAGALSRAMHEGNQAIAAHVEAHPEADGMGCTLTALLFDGRRMGLLHVGDSRAYLLRDDVLTQITKDDTFVQSLVDRGELTAEEAHVHPRRSLILKALTGEPVEPTTNVREARVGDRYLLCSDGLSDPVSTETIAETLGTGSADAAAERLVQLALRSGGPDNVTVVVADVVDSPRGGTVVPVVVGAASTDEPGEIAVHADTAAGRAAAFSRAQVASQGAAAGAAGSGGAGSGTGNGAGDESHDDEVDPAAPRGTRWRFALSVVGVLALIAGIVGVSALLVRSNYFVTEEDSQVVVKRGISGEVFGISLASVSQVACLTADGTLTLHDPEAIPSGCDVFTLGDLREPARESVRAGMPSGSLSDANAQVSRLAQDNLLPACEPEEAGEEPAEAITSPSSPTASPQPSNQQPSNQQPSPQPSSEQPSPQPSPRPTPAPVPGVDCRAVS
ncbi:PP2C family protein-serine/threonine phosphatase [Dietzia psychralcaliphila]|uniref:PP2C family protein-serine/threonine phosphatase n=1 Tax=Dietzia psychralcaliphila TaxID=139021 RepID=UPI001C1E239D|nr:protein phosphatase 2C domain-containing protein [Dietzia psychralcaliphila]